MTALHSANNRIDGLNPFYNFSTTVDVLRLDLLHPIISGNKWFKLKGYMAEASTQHKKTIITFGGAFSNHIVATSAAARLNGFDSMGVIRGERPLNLSPTLTDAERFGMKLFFVSRGAYQLKTIPDNVFIEAGNDAVYIIPEGGYGGLGAIGAGEILKRTDTASYTHIITAVGTGTTLAGLVVATGENQKIVGISSLKNNTSLDREIKNLLPAEKQNAFQLFHDYHFGGYAKHTLELLHFMNDLYDKTRIPTDFVYTAKVFYAVFDLLKKGFFSDSDKVLIIHTGGLQGNRSLKAGTLIYP